jgi:magnesium-transporting ATPase (P-type)
VVTTKDLLPGDIISLAFKKRNNTNLNSTINLLDDKNNNSSNTNNKKIKNIAITSNDEIVPCDCLLIRGFLVFIFTIIVFI